MQTNYKTIKINSIKYKILNIKKKIRRKKLVKTTPINQLRTNSINNNNKPKNKKVVVKKYRRNLKKQNRFLNLGEGWQFNKEDNGIV